MKTDCYTCIYRLNVAGNAHIKCANPDHSMTGNEHGIKHGWFFYPFLFDPIWRTKECANFKKAPENYSSLEVSPFSMREMAEKCLSMASTQKGG